MIRRFWPAYAGRLVLSVALVSAAGQLALPRAASAAIAFVQVNAATPQTPQTVVAIPFTAAQTAGNLNVVVVGWNDTVRSVVSVVDSSGNPYTLAVGPTLNAAGGLSQSIYFAPNIAGAATNTVTVTFNGAAAYADIRILEYSGVDIASPVDVVAVGTGSSTTSSTASVTTTNANDMIFGANMVTSLTSNQGTNFTRRIISTPDGDIAEDRLVTAVGSYNATATLSPSGQWVMQMVAFRAAGSPPPGPDTTPPTAPSNVAATAASNTQINLTWTASTDNVGVTGYRVERCEGAGCSNFAQIATPAVTNFSDTGLTALTSYSYRVLAVDAVPNLSPYSNTATASTLAAPDITPPTAPSNLTATPASATQINLSWTAATDNVAVTGYRVERCQGAGCSNFAQVGTSTGTTFNNTGLTASTSYSYRVLAVDAVPNLSPYSNTATTATPAPPDTTPPTAPSGLAATAAGSTQINLTWTASTDAVGVTGYRVERCQGSGCNNFAQIATPTTTAFSDTGLTASTLYRYRVRATDAAANLSGYSNTSNATTQAATDTTPPTAPSNLIATTASATQINLAWMASTDAVGVTGYRVERCQGAGCSNFAQIGTPTTATFNDTGRTASTSYSYRVRATDAAANLSTYSNIASATTSASDTTPPTAPTNLIATAASSAQINLTWTAATDAVGVTGYRVERCQSAGCSTFAQIATPTATTFNDTGLAASTSYSYRVRATDAAANLGPYSTTATATTQAAPPPTGNITFVQINSATPQTTQTTVALPYIASQTAGSLNVVVVGWNDSIRSVVSVTDSRSNVYALGVGPTVNVGGSLSQAIFYAKNIASAPAGGNTVTVTFDGPADHADVRILEYSGVDLTAPVDVTAAATGSGTSSATPAVTTTNGTDLLFGANMVSTLTSAAGSGFTSRVITSPDGDIAEDRLVTAAGSYNASATLGSSGQWVMQMIAFRAAGSPPPVPDTTPPTAPLNLTATPGSTQIVLSWTAATDNVGISGYRVERCQGAGCTNFLQVGTPTATTFNNTGLTVTTSYTYRVRAADISGNLGPYSNIVTATTAVQDNPIVTENQQPGTSAWQLGDLAGRPYASDSVGQIKGYASEVSVNKGQSISFHVSVNTAQTFTVNVYRMGWYNGLGGRLMHTAGPISASPQPTCPMNGTTGLIECNWAVGYTLQTQTTWTSGIYLAVLKNANNFYTYIIFTVRDDSRVGVLLYQQPVTTYQAYNGYPDNGSTGKSLYEHNSAGPNTMAGTPRAVKVSFDRPYSGTGAGQFMEVSEFNILRWLEKSGYDVTYSTDVDTHRDGVRLLSHRGFLSLPHDEYWSKPMYDAAIAARDAGVSLAFFGANSIYWQVRFEPSSTGRADRILVCYKETSLDPLGTPSLKTIKWRDGPVSRPEQALVGVEFTDGPKTGTANFVVANSGNWVWAGTGFTNGAVVPGIVWYEADRVVNGDPAPAAVSGTYTMLAVSPYTGSTSAETQNSSIYQALSGAWVFGAGTMGWGWSLDNFYPEGSVNTVDARMQRATKNILDRFLNP